MSKYIHKSHNVSVLLYHLVCPTKYRKVVLSKDVDVTLKNICLEISKRYELYFIEIVADENHVHFLIQSVPAYSPTKLVTIVKSITAKEIFKNNPEVKKQLWGGKFWSSGYFINTISKHGNEEVIAKYVKKQGLEQEYQQIYYQQLMLNLDETS